eukprot:479666_1
MISIGFTSLLIGITLGVDICYPIQVGSDTCLNQADLTFPDTAPEGYAGNHHLWSSKRTCDANGGQVTRDYATVDCSGDVVGNETVVAKDDLGALCGECEDYYLISGAFYPMDDCAGTAIGTFSLVTPGSGCDGDGTEVLCAGSNSVEVTRYANDDCSGTVMNATVTHTSGGCIDYSGGLTMKFDRV